MTTKNKKTDYSFIDTTKTFHALPDLRTALISTPQLQNNRITAVDHETELDLNVVHNAVHRFLSVIIFNIVGLYGTLEVKPNKKVTVISANTLTSDVDILIIKDPKLGDVVNKEIFDKDPIVIAAKNFLKVFKDKKLHSYVNYVSLDSVETGSLKITYNGYCIKIIIDKQLMCTITITASNT